MKKQKREQSKLMRVLQLSSIAGIFIIVAAIVFMIFGIIPANAYVIDVLGLVGILAIACILATPWVERLEQKDFSRKVCIVFISVISVCAFLWVVCWLLTMHVIINKLDYSAILFNLVRISLILTIQFLVASTITYVLLKYKKTMILFQAVTYLSNLYIDFYATYIIVCLNIVGGDVKFPGSGVIFSKFMIALLVIAFLYVIISNAVVKSQERKRTQRVTENYFAGELNENGEVVQTSETGEQAMVEPTPVQTPEEKLKRLKNMKEEGLITEEEYEQKKAEIMKDF